MIENQYKDISEKTKSSSKDQVKKEKRIWIIIGFTLQGIAFFLFAAFCSHYFHGTQDQLAIEQFIKQEVSFFKLKVQNNFGVLGALSSYFFVFRWFGAPAFLISIFLFLSGHKLIYKTPSINLFYLLNLITFCTLWFNLACGYITLQFHYYSLFETLVGGIGMYLAGIFHTLLGKGTLLLLLFTFIIFMILVFNITSLNNYFQFKLFTRLKAFFQRIPSLFFFHKKVNKTLPILQKDTKEENNLDITSSNQISEVETFFVERKETKAKFVEQVKNDDPKIDDMDDKAPYEYPSIHLLKNHAGSQPKVTKAELEENKNTIIATLMNFKIGIATIKATIGPTVTLYEIVPEAGIKISKIKNLEDDIALSLSALGIRIIAPIPGKGTIGIEVPNKEKEIVSLKKLIATDTFLQSKMELPLILGKDVSNEIYIQDLTKMPHLLIAGATGQGKSVCLNVLLTSLIYKKHPSQLKLVLVDPKKVELSLYNKLKKHFLAHIPNTEEPIIIETKKVINTLNGLCIEMDTRYELLKEAGVRNIKEYNEKFIRNQLDPDQGHQFLPYIVLVIDEFADMMMTAGKEIEIPIARLAQLARAIGIHLVLATQRPSVNVITGIIKANFPVRISFRVTSKIDSRTILDAGGADQLIGQGDMLLSINSELIRLQCPFLDTQEVEAICNHIDAQEDKDYHYELPEAKKEQEDIMQEENMKERDPLFEEAANLIVTHQQGSTSLIQRKMKLGYNRSGRLMDQLEAAGIVGPSEGSKAREVLIQDLESLRTYL